MNNGNEEIKNSLSKILTVLYVIAALIFINTVVLVVVNNDKFTNKNTSMQEGTGNNTGNEPSNTGNETVEYDVSSFKEINVDEFVNAYNGSELQVIYVGRETCGHCVNYVPVLKQVQEALGFTPLYLDITTVDQAGAEKIYALNSEYFSENFGYTPMTLVVKNGEIVDETVGAMQYDATYEFLKPYFE